MSRTSLWPAPVREALDQFQTQWQARPEAERRHLQWAGIVLLVLLVVLVGIRPALKARQDMPARIAAAQSQLLGMQGQAAEALALRGATLPPATQVQAQVQAVGERLKAKVSIQGARAQIEFDGVPGAQLNEALLELRRTTGAKPVEMDWQGGPDGYKGRMVLSLRTGS